MAVHRPLGQLNCVKIWHDNSGKGSKASWYLKHVIVHDLQTREKFYFLCEKWLAVEKDDGRLDRLLGVCGDKQKTELAYLTSRQVRNNINDRHLWLSILTRPAQSSFTRLNRLMCSAFIVYTSMMITMIFYQLYEPPKTSYVTAGPFYFSSAQLQVATFTNLLLIIPSLLLIELYRRSRRRVSRISRLKETIRTDVAKSNWYKTNQLRSLSEPKTEEKFNPFGPKPKYQRFRLPWWCKIVGYVIIGIFIITSIIVVLLLGIQFGNMRVQQWFTSFIISILAFMFLVYPIQVLLRIIFYTALTRQYNEPFDLDDDDYDPDRYSPLNDDEEWLHVENKVSSFLLLRYLTPFPAHFLMFSNRNTTDWLCMRHSMLTSSTRIELTGSMSSSLAQSCGSLWPSSSLSFFSSSSSIPTRTRMLTFTKTL